MGNQQAGYTSAGSVSLSHFRLKRTLGRGNFGKVRLVESRESGVQYALKYFSKDDLIRRRMGANVCVERDILEAIHHTFICNMHFSFQDDYHLYLVLNYMEGGDLRFHSTRRVFSSAELIFIAAELASALCFLHSKGIVHRDVKPDNILLDAQGHAHLTDFNVATYIGSDKLASHTGTPQYMAPELVLGRGYGHGVDWWALGITLYELMFKRIPFKGNLKKHRMSIVNQPIQWPKCAAPSPLLNLLTILLVKDPNLRFPVRSSMKEVKAHASFAHIDFEKLESKKLTPPFCPDITGFNVESGLDLEELLLDELPLESIPSKRNFNTIKRMPERLLFLEYSFRDYNLKIDPPVDPKALKNFRLPPPPAGFLRRVTRSFSGGFPQSQSSNLDNCYASRPSFITRLRLKKSAISIRNNPTND